MPRNNTPENPANPANPPEAKRIMDLIAEQLASLRFPIGHRRPRPFIRPAEPETDPDGWPAIPVDVGDGNVPDEWSRYELTLRPRKPR